MDWKIFLATFTSVFAAELADKTQLVGISLSAKSGKPLTVWLGSVASYMIVTLLSVFIGSLMANYVKPDAIRLAGGFIFVVMGILMISGKL